MQIFGKLIQRVKSSLAGQNCETCLEITMVRKALSSVFASRLTMIRENYKGMISKIFNKNWNTSVNSKGF
jgi:hypothetical protein